MLQLSNLDQEEQWVWIGEQQSRREEKVESRSKFSRIHKIEIEKIKTWKTLDFFRTNFVQV